MLHPTNGTKLLAHSKNYIPIGTFNIVAGIAAESTDDYELLDVNEYITKGKEGFVTYRVTGDSMLEYIKAGYIVFADPYEQPKSGDIIATCLNGRINIKIFQRRSNGLFLVSANKKYKPCEVTETDNFHVLGVVKGHLAVY